MAEDIPVILGSIKRFLPCLPDDDVNNDNTSSIWMTTIALVCLLIDLTDAGLDVWFCSTLISTSTHRTWGIFLLTGTILALLSIIYSKYDTWCERSQQRTKGWKWGKIYIFETVGFCFEDCALAIVLSNTPELYNPNDLGTRLTLLASIVSASIGVVFMIVISVIYCRGRQNSNTNTTNPNDNNPQSDVATNDQHPIHPSQQQQVQQQHDTPQLTFGEYFSRAGQLVRDGNFDQVEERLVMDWTRRRHAAPLATIAGQMYLPQIYFTVLLILFLIHQKSFGTPVNIIAYTFYGFGIYFSFYRLYGFYKTRNDVDRSFYKIVYPNDPNDAVNTTITNTNANATSRSHNRSQHHQLYRVA